VAVASGVAFLLATSLAACGGGESGPPTLNWYINPDNGGQANIAARCTEESGGQYRIATSGLPTQADAQREQLVRRLAANDSSIDIMSLDPPFVPEFAEAGYLRPFTDAESREFLDDVLEAPAESAKWKDQLVAAPLWANTQLLWYRKSVAQQAGVDPTAENFTWDQMIDAAKQAGKRVDEQGNRYEGYMVWVNAMVSSAGGTILENPEAGSDAKPALNTPAGQRAAEIINKVATTVANPSLSTAMEEDARASFQGDDGGFMLNWPYIYAAALTEVEAGSLDKAVYDDIAWARYPRVDASTPSKPPLGGIHIGIGAFSKNPDLAVDAVRCITSTQSMKEFMLAEGNPAARAAVFDDPEVKEAFQMSDLIRESIRDAGARPLTPYYTDVSTSIQRTWHPPSSVSPDSTPNKSADLISNVLQDKVLL
jgi:multiple sugar transport system substrate-binding protein